MSRVPALRRRAAKGASLPNPTAELGALLAGTRRPLRRALERLAEDSPRIHRAFRGLLRRIEPRRDDYTSLASMDPLACYRSLSKGGRSGSGGDEAYRLAVERAALTLMRLGVPEDHAIAAVGLHLEASLGSLDHLAEARALVRLTSATQWLIAAAYCEDRVAGLRRLDDRERQKLSGDLHDEVGADLVVLKLYVEMIASELANGSRTPLGPKLEETLALIAHAIESVRRLTLDLGPAFLDTLGFLPALRGFVRQFSQRTGIRVRLAEPRAPVSMPASHETALYRVLLGALSNVAKHSKARHATVALTRKGSVFSMSVEDDGRGFDPGAVNPDSTFGLTAMRERVRGLRGHLSIRSRRARGRGEKSGTRIEVRLPLRKGAGS
jgi:signal transduction histidine kinase